MKKRTYFIVLSVLVMVLVVVIVLTIINNKQKSDDQIWGKEAREYLKYYDLSIEKDNNEKYFIIKGLTKDNGVSLRSIEFPETIDGLKVKKIVTNENKFSEYRFVQKITIPKYVEYIGTNEVGGDCYFENAINLISIDVDTDNQYFSSKEGVLYNKDKTTLLKYPADKRLMTTTYKTIDTVKAINKLAFYNATEITQIIISKSVEVIGESSFLGCKKLNTVVFEEDSNLVEIGSFAFRNNESLERIYLPVGTKTLNTGAFYGCKALKELYIPTTITTFGQNICSICYDEIKIKTPRSNIEFLLSLEDKFGIKDFSLHLEEE